MYSYIYTYRMYINYYRFVYYHNTSEADENIPSTIIYDQLSSIDRMYIQRTTTLKIQSNYFLDFKNLINIHLLRITYSKYTMFNTVDGRNYQHHQLRTVVCPIIDRLFTIFLVVQEFRHHPQYHVPPSWWRCHTFSLKPVKPVQ